MSPNRTPCPALTRARVEKRDVLRTARRKARIVSPHAQPPSARPRPAEAARALARPGFPQVLENGLGNEDASGLGRAVLSPTWATAPEPRGYFAAIGVPDAPRDVVVARKSRRKPLQRLKTDSKTASGILCPFDTVETRAFRRRCSAQPAMSLSTAWSFPRKPLERLKTGAEAETRSSSIRRRRRRRIVGGAGRPSFCHGSLSPNFATEVGFIGAVC